MSLFLDELTMLADIFDASGLHKEAESVDNIIKEAAEIHDIIQKRVEEEAEPDRPSPRVIKFLMDFEQALNTRVQAQDSQVNYDVKEEVMTIAQNLLKENTRDYAMPGSGQSGMSMHYKASNDVITMIDSIVELEDEVEGKGAYEGREIEDRERNNSREKLQKLYDIVNKIKEGNRPKDPETYRLMKDYYNERRGREIW